MHHVGLVFHGRIRSGINGRNFNVDYLINNRDLSKIV